MRIVWINYGHFVHQRRPEDLLDEFETVTGWAEGLAAAGGEVVVVQGFSCDARRERGGVTYEFVAGPFAPRLRRWHLPRRLHRAVLRHRPDVVHLNGLLYPLQARDLRRALPAGSALVAQHHAERPERGILAEIQRWGLRAVDGFFFSGRELAEPWHERALISPRQPVFEILEGSTRFRLGDRGRARATTGLEGDPVCISVANLKAGKDPLTVCDGFERALAELPEARLYLLYRERELLPEVRKRLAGSPLLERAVKLVGTVPHPEVERYLNSADLFLAGSRYEGSGYALVEALACGAAPVVTDIPAFRFILGSRVGATWTPGRAEELARALVMTARQPIADLRRAARRRFETCLTYEAIGRRALAAYSELHDLRRGRR